MLDLQDEDSFEKGKSGMLLSKLLCEKARKEFIKRCIAFDTPRLESEQYPEDVRVEADLVYDGGHALDLYIPPAVKDEKAAYLLIHGGAFVYGTKELDKCFGMHLAKASGIAVANMDYTLMPDTGLKGQIGEIFAAIRFLQKEKNIEKIHTIGDSAGGYLALLSGILLGSEKARDEFFLPKADYPACESSRLICCAFLATPKSLGGCYFDTEKELQPYIYDLTKAIEQYSCPPLTLITGDKDTLLKQNRELKKRLESLDVPFTYKEFQSAEDRVMHHVFCIAHPDWPEGAEAIKMCL